MTAALPVPQPTPETLRFWEGTRADQLVIQQCSACDSWVFHPRIRCPECGSEQLVWRQASGRGRLWSYIIVHKAEPGFEDRAPYVLGVVELDEGPHMMGIIVGAKPDPGQLKIDSPLLVEFEDRGTERVPVWRQALA